MNKNKFKQIDFNFSISSQRKKREGEARMSIDGAFQSSSICTSNAKKDFVSGGLELKWKRNFLVKNEKVKKKQRKPLKMYRAKH